MLVNLKRLLGHRRLLGSQQAGPGEAIEKHSTVLRGLVKKSKERQQAYPSDEAGMMRHMTLPEIYGNTDTGILTSFRQASYIKRRM
jgi:hypothetical protein